MPRPQRRGAPCCRGTRRGVSSNGRPVRCCQRRRSRGNTGGGTAPCRLPGAPWRHPALAPPRLLHGARGGASVPHVSTSGGAGAGCTSDARGVHSGHHPRTTTVLPAHASVNSVSADGSRHPPAVCADARQRGGAHRDGPRSTARLPARTGRSRAWACSHDSRGRGGRRHARAGAKKNHPKFPPPFFS